MTYLCATAMTPRDFGPPTFTPREHLPQPGRVAAQRRLPVRLRTFGMSNDDVYRCHAALTIPTDPTFGSLNLAAAHPGGRLRVAPALGGFGFRAPRTARWAGRCPGRGRHAGALGAGAGGVGFLDPAAPKS